MQYTIHLKGMEFRAFHGCYELEQKVGNRFSVDMDIVTELGDLAQSDDVTQAVNYLTVYEIVRAQMSITRHTIEAATASIIEAVKASYPQITEVNCTVAKLAPPLGGKVGRVSVTLRG
ncbi:MAG: dihydroneopterin aldolase [Rikenellaceae bacterium]